MSGASQQFPTPAQFRPINPIYNKIAAALMNDPESYVGMRVLPPSLMDGVAEKTGTIFRAAVGAMFGDGSTNFRRAPGQPFPRQVGPGLESITYIADQYANEAMWADEDVRSAQIDLKRFRIAACLEPMQITRERVLLDTLGTAGNWTGSFSAGTAWTAAGADPVADVNQARRAIKLYGKKINTIVLPFDVQQALSNSDAFCSFLPTTEDRNSASEEQIQRFFADKFGVPRDRVFIADAVQNTANQGAAASLSFIGGNWMWAGYIELDGTKTVNIDGSTIQTTATALVRLPVEDGTKVEEYRDPSTRTEFMNATYEEAIRVVNPQLGCLVSGVV